MRSPVVNVRLLLSLRWSRRISARRKALRTRVEVLEANQFWAIVAARLRPDGAQKSHCSARALQVDEVAFT
jgi:hypothetical protein